MNSPVEPPPPPTPPPAYSAAAQAGHSRADDRAGYARRFPPPTGQPVGGRAAAWDDRRRRRRTMRTMRWVMVGIGLVGGLLLMTAGATLTGAIIAGLAVARGIVLLVMSRQMRPRRP